MVANKVAFFAGTANGMFSFVTSFSLTAGDVPVSVVARDINGDSKIDLVTTCYNSDLVRILYGDGVGGISSQSSTLVAKTPHETAVGDFNGDGLMDLNTIHDTGGTLSVMLNRGPTGFVSAKLIDSSTGPIRIADFNGDGNQDLLLNSTRIILGNGNGTFASPVTPPAGFVGLDVVVGDINNDGKFDYVTSGSGGFTAHINNGGGSFPGPINISTTGGQIGLGDFNSDGKVDVLVAYAADIIPNIKIFQGDGAGNFVLNGAATLPRGTTTLAVADLNHDNKPDLVVHQAATGSFNPRTAVLIGNGLFTFAPPAFYALNECSALSPEISGSDGGSLIPVADFNRDGHLDVMRGGTCSLLLGNGTGSFTSVPAPNLTGQPGDLDRDGVVDLANTAFNVGEIRLALNDGTGTQFSTTSYAAGRAGDSIMGGIVRIGDFNNDGVADIVFVNPNPVSSVTGTWLMLSKNLARGLVTADFDGDGITDISVFRPSDGTWYVIRSSTDTFYRVQFGLNGDRPVPGDYDGDGKTDIAVFRNGDWYMLRSSDGAFFQQHYGSAGDTPVPADYDGDGLTNIAVFRPSSATWYTSTNPATNYGAVQWGVSTDIPAPADFDGDGRTDVAVFRPTGGIWYALETSSGFVQQQFGNSGDRLVPVDFDGDGRANFSVFRPSSGYWYTSTNPATNFGGVQWGASADIPAPGYFDGDNKADLTVYRTGAWYVLYSNSASYSLFNFGSAGDIPIPSAYYPQ
jgi:hypothetical protein